MSEMRCCSVVGGVLVGLALSAVVATAHGPIPPQPVEWVPGQLLVRLAPGLEPVAAGEMSGDLTPGLTSLNERFGVETARPLLQHYGPIALRALEGSGKAASVPPGDLELMDRLGRWVLLQAGGDADVEAMVAAYEALDEVEVAEPNYRARLVESVSSDPAPAAQVSRTSSKLHWVPNDPDFGSQWGLDFIDAPSAWDITQGAPAQVIAIIDTGVDLDHPDLATKIWDNADEEPGDGNGDTCPGLCLVDDDGDGLVDEDRNGIQMGDPGWDGTYADDDDENGYVDDFRGWDWIGLGQGFPDNDPQDDNGHGTHCAGIAAAATDNGVGIAGACPLCTVMPLKAFQSSGTASYSDIAKAVDYAYRNGATVINMSFGSYADSSLVYDALSLAYSTSVLVAAAGNDHRPRSRACGNPSLFYPAHYGFVLGVEAGESGGGLAGFSNYCTYDLRNPGVSIQSTVLNNSYATWSGTSMAAPFVAGTAALLRTQRDGTAGWGPELYFGQLVNSAGNAVQALTIVPTPDLRFVRYEMLDPVGSCPTCDGDGRPDSGETVEIVVTVRNWWGNAIDVNGTLTTADALATVVDGDATWGSIGPNASDDNANNPFRLEVSSSAGNNRDIVFDLSVNAGNGGTGIAEQIVLTVERGVEKGGILSASQTWTAQDLYLVTGNLLVDEGVTLTVEPGTEVQVYPGVSISVRGEIVARGTASDRILFSGNSGSWGSFVTTGSSVPAGFDAGGGYVSGSVLEFCVFRDAGGSSGLPALEVNGTYVARSVFHANSAPVAVSTTGRPAVVENNLVYANEGWSNGLNLWAGSTVRHNTIVANYNGVSVIGPGATGQLVANNLIQNQHVDYIATGGFDSTAVGNFWGTTDSEQIEARIWDFFDNPSLGVAYWDPPLSAPDPDAPPVVANIALDPPSPVSVGTLTFTITFSHPMRTDILPEVFFGPAEPWTSHQVNTNGYWLDPVTYVVGTEITVFTGDGLQKITVVGAEDPEGFPIPTGDHRFGFEIVTSGTSAAALQASGGIGHVDLDWFPSTLPDVAGYNLYRADQSGGPYEKLNGPLIVDTDYADWSAEPGVEYWYVYRVVNTEVEEGPDSDEASAAALDDVPPVIEHTPVTSASAGLPITLVATITDNVATPTARLFHRELGSADPWDQVTMINATGSQYTANIPSGDAVAPGREYYLEASDGVNTVQHGTPVAPHGITILDRPTVSDVSPDHGPLAGGTSVTITGTNFQIGCTVTFGGVAAIDVVVADPQTITCTTPAHYPAVADVAVTNPNTAVGTLTRAFTYEGTPTIVRLPTTAHDRMSVTTLGVSTPGVEGMISATLELTYDPTVLAVQTTGTGSLTPGWSLSSNTTTPGTVRLSLAGTAAVTGPGTLAEVTVQVVGDPGAVSPLAWVQATLNEGVIPATAENGQVTVNNAFDVSGTVTYYTAARPVEGVTMTLDGSASYSQATGADGAYAIANVPSDNYVLTGSKSDGVEAGDISALDASFVLQHDAGLITLDPHQSIAGDVNASGQATAFDASLILQHAVGLIALPFPGSGRVWAFSPPSRGFTPLNLDQTGQDFAGILIGDVTGNWGDGLGEGLTGSATLAFAGVPACGGGTARVSLEALEPGIELLSTELTLTFDPAVVEVVEVRRGALSSNWTLVVNDQTPGQVRVALAGSNPVIETGDLLEVDYAAGGNYASWLAASRAFLNEGLVDAELPPVEVNSCALFGSGFEDGTSGGWTVTVP